MINEKSKNLTSALAVIPVMTALTAVGSFIRIPVPPVPFTLQTLFVYLAGYLLGAKQGALSQYLFLLIGLIGLPVFGSGGGPGYVLQPTFGYLLGFPLAAWIIGKLTARGESNLSMKFLLLAGSVGILVILIPGVTYLYLNINFIAGGNLDWSKALLSGVVIFFPAEIIKLTAAAMIAKRLKPVLVYSGVGEL